MTVLVCSCPASFLRRCGLRSGVSASVSLFFFCCVLCLVCSKVCRPVSEELGGDSSCDAGRLAVIGSWISCPWDGSLTNSTNRASVSFWDFGVGFGCSGSFVGLWELLLVFRFSVCMFSTLSRVSCIVPSFCFLCLL